MYKKAINMKITIFPPIFTSYFTQQQPYFNAIHHMFAK